MTATMPRTVLSPEEVELVAAFRERDWEKLASILPLEKRKHLFRTGMYLWWTTPRKWLPIEEVALPE